MDKTGDSKDNFQITITGKTTMGDYELDLTGVIVADHRMFIEEVIELGFGSKKCRGVLTHSITGTILRYVDSYAFAYNYLTKYASCTMK